MNFTLITLTPPLLDKIGVTADRPTSVWVVNVDIIISEIWNYPVYKDLNTSLFIFQKADKSFEIHKTLKKARARINELICKSHIVVVDATTQLRDNEEESHLHRGIDIDKAVGLFEDYDEFNIFGLRHKA
jgi:hypothetical protein